MVSMSLFCRIILSKKSKTFWDHALTRTASRFPGQGGPTTVRQKANRREQGCDKLPAR
jgi:hypothetical protein